MALLGENSAHFQPQTPQNHPKALILTSNKPLLPGRWRRIREPAANDLNGRCNPLLSASSIQYPPSIQQPVLLPLEFKKRIRDLAVSLIS